MFEDPTGKIRFCLDENTVECSLEDLKIAIRDGIAYYFRENGKDILPFSVAYLLQLNEKLRFLYRFSKPHRELFLSKKFDLLTKNLFHEILGKGGFVLENEPLYSHIWEEVFEIYADIQYDAVKSLLRPKKSDSILEIGPATGNLAVKLARDVGKLVGVDTSEAYVNYSKKKARDAGIKNCKFIVGKYPMSTEENFNYIINFGVTPPTNDITYILEWLNIDRNGKNFLFSGFYVRDQIFGDLYKEFLKSYNYEYKVARSPAPKLGNEIYMENLIIRKP